MKDERELGLKGTVMRGKKEDRSGGYYESDKDFKGRRFGQLVRKEDEKPINRA